MGEFDTNEVEAPLDAVALSASVLLTKVTVGGGEKLMVWAILVI